MEGNHPVQSHSHAQQPLKPQISVQEHCPGETGLPSSVFHAIWKYLLYRKGTSIRQAPVFRHLRALQKSQWKFIISMNEL